MWKMGFQPTKRVRFEDEESGNEEPVQLAKRIATSEHAEAFIRGVVIAEGPKEGPEAEALRQKFLADYKGTVFDTRVRGRPPIRGLFGEKVKPGAIPKKQRPYQFWGIARCGSRTRFVGSRKRTGCWRMAWGHGTAQPSRFQSRTTTVL